VADFSNDEYDQYSGHRSGYSDLKAGKQ